MKHKSIFEYICIHKLYCHDGGDTNNSKFLFSQNLVSDFGDNTIAKRMWILSQLTWINFEDRIFWKQCSKIFFSKICIKIYERTYKNVLLKNQKRCWKNFRNFFVEFHVQIKTFYSTMNSVKKFSTTFLRNEKSMWKKLYFTRLSKKFSGNEKLDYLLPSLKDL